MASCLLDPRAQTFFIIHMSQIDFYIHLPIYTSTHGQLIRNDSVLKRCWFKNLTTDRNFEPVVLLMF